MIPQKTRRQTLRNREKSNISRGHQHKKMEIQEQNENQPISKPNVQTQRHFGKDLTNAMSSTQNIDRWTSWNAPRLGLQKLSHFVQNTSMMIEQLGIQSKKSEVSIYEESISAYLQSIQKLTEPTNDYLPWQQQIDEHMRQVLVSWLIDLHERFRLKEQTLFKSITIMDRYLSVQPIKRSKLQLLGVAAIYISCKYQEVLLQDIKRFVSVCGNTYSVQQLLEMQSKILILMNFNLVTTSSLRVMQLKCSTLCIPEDIRMSSQFLLQMCLIEYSMCKYGPSVMSLSSLYLSAKILNNKSLSANMLLKEFQIQEGSFKACLKDMLQIFKTKNSSRFIVLRRKYSKKGVCEE